MPAWLIPLLPTLVQYAVPVLVAGAGWLVHRYVKDQKLVAAFDWLREHVGPVVSAVEQTYVDAVTKNGSLELTPAQKQEALTRAVQAILAQIPADYLAILRAAFPAPGALETYVTTLVEGSVKDLQLKRDAFADIPGLSNAKAGK